MTTGAEVDSSINPALGTGRPPSAPDRRAVLAAVQDLIFEAARTRPVVIGADDCDAIDEPSAAMLGVLARLAKQRAVVVIATSAVAAQARPALTVLRDAAMRTQLDALDPEQSESLLRAIFGDVAHVTSLAATLFELASGNPRAMMTLAEDLIERGLARYEAGSWALPSELHARDLPRSVSAALLAHLASLSPDARELAQALALTDSTALSLDQYPALAGHDDHARMHRALDELVEARILVRTGERFRFSQPGIAERLEAELGADRKRHLHEMLARTLAQSAPGDLRVARHWLLGGHERQAIEQLCAAYREEPLVEPGQLDLLEAAVAAAERIALAPETTIELQSILLQAAAVSGRCEIFVSHAEHLLLQCQRDSGLLDRGSLDRQEEPAERAGLVTNKARERNSSADGAVHGLRADQIETVVARIWGAHTILAGICHDSNLLAELPSLEPLVDEYPNWKLIEMGIGVARCLHEGRTTLAIRGAAELAALPDPPVDPRLDPKLVSLTRLAHLHMLALFAATSGHPKLGSMVDQLERTPGFRSNAWRVRMVYELMQGHLEAASECQRRAELLHVQDSGRTLFAGSTVRIELLAHMYAENLLGIKRVIDRIEPLATAYPGWRPTLAIARCHYRRLQGDARGGLAVLEPALTLKPGQHIDWWLVAYSHVRVLCDLDRCAEACAAGERYVQTWTDAQLSNVDYGLQQVTAEALTRVGRHADARRMIDRYLDSQHQVGARGLRLGIAYETAARVAEAAGDTVASQRYAELCALEYKGGRDLLLKAKLERLAKEIDSDGEPASTPALTDN